MDDIFDMLEGYMDDDDIYISDNSPVYTVDE